MISPRRDAYGPEADRSNLADYLEILALDGQSLRNAELADFLKDRDWVVRSRELFQDGSADDEPTEDDEDGGVAASPSEIAAGDVFEVLSLRADALGERYPFDIDDSQVSVRPELTDNHLPYLALLAVTVAHHQELETDLVPERVFEECVAQVMATRGLLTIDTGAAGRGVGGFAHLVRGVGNAIGLIAAPSDALYRTHAKEEGVDTVSHLSWGDHRAGHWVFIGQATCAKSNEWAQKIQEPRSEQWGDLLTCVVPPVAYLAVPHHVEDEQMANLSRNHGRLVLDRLRLSRHLGPLSDQQTALLNVVRAADVYHPLR